MSHKTDCASTFTSELWVVVVNGVGGDRTDATGSVGVGLDASPLDAAEWGDLTEVLAATLGFGLGFGLGRGDGGVFRRKGLSAMEPPHPFGSVHWTMGRSTHEQEYVQDGWENGNPIQGYLFSFRRVERAAFSEIALEPYRKKHVGAISEKRILRWTK